MRVPVAVSILCLIALPWLGGCAGGPKQVSAVDTAAITLAVDGVITAFNAALAAKDTAAIASLYAEDAVVLPADQPRVDGRLAIRDWWAEGLAAPGLRLVLVPGRTTVAPAGDLATVVGAYDYQAAGAKGSVRREVGKFVAVLKPVGSRWQIVIDTWNRDAAPAAAER